jgi:hypothetical protein
MPARAIAKQPTTSFFLGNMRAHIMGYSAHFGK